MEFRILGPLEVWEAGQAVTLSGAKPRALLAILLIHANRVVAADRLIDLLWDETPSDTVNNTLQVCVSKLRRNLEPGHVHGSPHQVVIGQPPGYLIRVDREQLDLTKFESLVGEARQSMADQAGLDPGPELQRLLKAILNQDPALDLQARVETSRPPKVSNLPLPLTSFVGRADAMSEVNSRLGQSRLLTLTGAGGIGKTRLAIQVIRGLLEAYTDGVALVELAPLTDPDLVPQSTAFALGLSDRSGRSLVATLTDYLRPRNLLLVLDNCEHLIDASARDRKSVV